MPRKLKQKIKVLKEEATSAQPQAAQASKRKRSPAATPDDSGLARGRGGRKRIALEEKSANLSIDSIVKLEDIKKETVKYEPGSDEKQAVEEEARSFKGLLDDLKKKLDEQEYKRLLKLCEQNDAKSVQQAADLISSKDGWSAELVTTFGGEPITKLDISVPEPPKGTLLPIDSFVPRAPLLRALFVQDNYTTLATLSLRNAPLINDDVAYLRLLPCLESLDLTNTRIGTEALHHLVCHKHTLEVLNLSFNADITDDAHVPLRALCNLRELFLRATSFTMPTLRRFVDRELPRNCRLISIPASCIQLLNDCDSLYCVEIPKGYLEKASAETISNLDLSEIKRNLELHKRFDKTISTSGTKIDLIRRLETILWNRRVDRRIVEVLGRSKKEF